MPHKERKRVKTLQDSSWRIVFKWVKAHAGLIGNEIADKLAKQRLEAGKPTQLIAESR